MQGLHILISTPIRVMRLCLVRREVCILEVEEIRHKNLILVEKIFGKVTW
jgi:hypothetical protein